MSIRATTDAREFDQRVRFERKRVDVGDDGSAVEVWALLKECWARVDGAKASTAEPMVDGGIHTQRDYTIWIRSDVFERYEITPLDRVLWKRQVFDIKDIPDQQLRGRKIAVIVRAGLNQG